MRIAQIAPLGESVPPKWYGGTTRVVSYLTEELVRHGHDVTLFASGDSVTQARLVPATERGLRLAGDRIKEPLAHYVRLLELVFREANEFDVLHFHLDYVHLPLSGRHSTASLTTMHRRVDVPDVVSVLREFPGTPFVAISDAQRASLNWLNWSDTVYHGLPRDLYKFNQTPEPYLAFLGRASPEKGLDRAIAIAQRTGCRLKIAAKIKPAEKGYFDAVIKPHLSHPLIEFIGEIGEQQKGEFLGNAQALLFPIDWPEPFGLVMIESLACGTPVITFNRGSVPEIIEHGKTGYVVDNVTEAALAVERIRSLSRQVCREVFEQRFTAARMANDYSAIYRRLYLAQRTGIEHLTNPRFSSKQRQSQTRLQALANSAYSGVARAARKLKRR